MPDAKEPIAIETRAEQTEHGWRDHDGFVGPFRPGNGPRTDPSGSFPTGPATGSPMPDIKCLTLDGAAFDLHQDRAGQPALFVFFRSAVW
ncbi:MAG: hypothetical protein AAF993_20510 [Pseudomonadota bacterium]